MTERDTDKKLPAPADVAWVGEKDRAMFAEVWTDFLDNNPDDLTSPEDLPDHALVTQDQAFDLVLDLAERLDLAATASDREVGKLESGKHIVAEGLGSFPQAEIPTEEAEKPVVGDAGRDAVWKVVHEVWQLLDDAETDSAGITTPNQERWHTVCEAMEELKALVPDCEGPFWGGYPVNYLWPKGAAK